VLSKEKPPYDGGFSGFDGPLWKRHIGSYTWSRNVTSSTTAQCTTSRPEVAPSGRLHTLLHVAFCLSESYCHLRYLEREMRDNPKLSVILCQLSMRQYSYVSI